MRFHSPCTNAPSTLVVPFQFGSPKPWPKKLGVTGRKRLSRGAPGGMPGRSSDSGANRYEPAKFAGTLPANVVCV